MLDIYWPVRILLLLTVYFIMTKRAYVNSTLNENTGLISEINRLRIKKNAVILSHYYQSPEIQAIADFVGDSLGLSQQAASTSADIIVFAGVYFMAETAKIINPGKKVLLPDMNSRCSLADSCEPEALKLFLAEHAGHVMVSYINCSAEIKAMSDIICTSSNAEKIINAIPSERKIIFVPDKNLGRYLIRKTGRSMVLWDGSCVVHEAFSIEKLLQLHLRFPDAKIVSHPESEDAVLKVSHYVGSTTGMINFVKKDSAKEFIVATEAGILYQMARQTTGKRLIPAPVNENNTCACSECGFMRLNTLQKIYDCLKDETPEIYVAEAISQKAILPIERMLEISKN